MTRVAVTGASGFIGLRLVRRLLDRGLDGADAQVVAVVRHADRLPADVRTRCTVVALDLAEASPDAIADATGRDAVVFHLAASASVGGGAAATSNNVRSVERLLAGLAGAPPRRLVFASSIGAVDRMRSDPCDAPLDEDAAPNPLTPYGRSKLQGERLVVASGIPFTIVRPTWVYGPGMRADSHLFALLEMVRRGALGARIRYPGKVSVIHVEDLCEALVCVALDDRALGRTLFASDGEPVALGALLTMMGDVTGKPAGSLRVPAAAVAVARKIRPVLPLALQNLCSDVLIASNARLEALGFRATVPLRRGIIELAHRHTESPAHWVVTGAASGIGKALVEQLHVRGAHVTAVDRNADGLAALRDDCPGTACVPADLSTSDGCARVVALIRESGRVDGVVNCAGIGARGAVGTVSAAAEQHVIGVNVTALVAASAAAVAQFGEQGGTLVNVASSAALQPLPFMAAYAASKAFVLSYSEAIAVETGAAGRIRVITVCPAGTDTGFQTSAGVKRADGERLLSPHHVAAQILRAADRGRSTTLFVGHRTWMMALLARLLPRRVVATLWGQMMRRLR